MNLTNKDRKTARKQVDFNPVMYGKIPPQAKDLEDAILGTILNESGSFDVIAEILIPECFYVEANQRIFTSMISMHRQSMPIDILTIVEELKKSEELDLIGGPYYITRLTNAVVSSANIEAHSRIILQKFIQREIIRICGENLSDAYEDSIDVFELLDKLETAVAEISLNNIRKDYKHISSILLNTISKIEERRNKGESVTGVTTGYPEINKITLGWQPSDLIIIAARPSVGKTAFALNLATNAAMDKTNPVPVGFFSLEMSENQLVERMISNQSEVWLRRLKTGNVDDEQMKTLYIKGVQPLSTSPVYIDDSSFLNVFDLRAKARKMVRKHKVGLIIIDYLQLMSGTGERNSNREQEISRISRELKKLAKDLPVPIIALSQLSRDVEKRGEKNKMPKLSDLRESGAIEQDADLVFFLYRPDEEDVTNNIYLKDKAIVKLAKHRNGELETFSFETQNQIQKWVEKGVLVKNPKQAAPAPNGYKPVAQANAEQASIFSQKGSSMNDDPDEDMPF